MKNILFLFVLLFFFSSCNEKESFIYDSNSLDSLVSKYVDNGSQALLLVRLEDRNGETIYQNSEKAMILFQIMILMKIHGLGFGQ